MVETLNGYLFRGVERGVFKETNGGSLMRWAETGVTVKGEDADRQ